MLLAIKNFFKLITLTQFLLGISLASANSSIDDLTKKIVTLRGEVEFLNSKLNASKEQMNASLRSKGNQISQIESQISQEEIKKKEITKKLEAAKLRLNQKGIDKNLQDVLLSSLSDIQNYIQHTIPFKTKERLASFQEIKKQIKDQVISPELAFSKLWSTVEDETRLTKENAIHRDTIILNNNTHLATIAKLGLVKMYFQTADGQVGSATKDSSGKYIFIKETQQERIELITKLMSGLKKQIRQGLYNIPI